VVAFLTSLPEEGPPRGCFYGFFHQELLVLVLLQMTVPSAWLFPFFLDRDCTLRKLSFGTSCPQTMASAWLLLLHLRPPAFPPRVCFWDYLSPKRGLWPLRDFFLGILGPAVGLRRDYFRYFMDQK
jgi:hypothetical protein